MVNEFTNANSRINNINKKNLTFSTLEYQLTKIQIGIKNVVNNIKKTETHITKINEQLDTTKIQINKTRHQLETQQEHAHTIQLKILKRHESLPKRYGSAWRNLISGICRIFA